VEPEDFATVLENRAEVVERLRQAGFSFVSLDLAGYSMGSLNGLESVGKQSA
jgi:PP-loop superfamily ATP-utilizing enzyme